MPTARVLLFFLVASLLVACTRGATTPTPTAPDRPPIVLTYLGVAGWRMDSGDHTLLVDPYFSRVDVEDSHEVISPDATRIAAHAPERADAILVGHSHYDHVLDVPWVAARTGATILGTESTLNLARAAGAPASTLRLASPGDAIEIGPFAVRVFRGLHSLTGQPPASIPRDVALPMSAAAYGEGGTLQFLARAGDTSVLFIGTANFIESELDGVRADVAVIATGLRAKVPDYTCRLMRALGRPSLVLANHFDAFWEPLGPKEMSIDDDARKDLDAFAEEVHACAPETKVVIPEHLRPITLAFALAP
jgi:L-ascorbate metabolism protein UlaG (beta-lactamase superfamily)